MIASHWDSDLIFGVLALKLGFVNRAQLTTAVGAWVRGRERPLGSILVEQQALDPADQTALDGLVERQVARHGERTLTHLASREPILPSSSFPDGIDDPDVRTVLDQMTQPADGARVGPRAADAGRFRVLRFHDRGGLGEVYVARDEEVGRDVALKQIRAEHADNAQRRARFLLEAEVTGSLEHPGIVPVYGVGVNQDGRPYYAMRFIRGTSLKDAINRFHWDDAVQADPGRRSLELRNLLDRFIDVCDAIAYAHSRGVLHRDLKPGNVMLGPFGETLVVDWGLAKVVGKGHDPGPSGEAALAPGSGSDVQPTQMGQRVGTPSYMPPEQSHGRISELGPQSDVYSLGATLYTILTGRPPFVERDVDTLLRRVERGEFPAPRSAAPWVDRALEAVCLKAMALRPDGRYDSPRSLAEDLHRWLADEPVSAWHEPLTKRLARRARRHRTLVTSSVAAAMVGLSAFGYLAYEARLRTHERVVAALGRVEALTTAEVRSLPLILEQFGADRRLVRDRLRQIALGDGSGPDDRRRLPGALGLFPDDPAQAHFLARRVRDPRATPDEVLVIREALATWGNVDELTGLFRGEVENVPGGLSDSQLRAAGVLARLAPGDDVWPALAPHVARKLVRENTLRVGVWREVFQPVARALTGPLRAQYALRSQPETRDLAFTLLSEFFTHPSNPNRPEDLAALLPDADPPRFEQVLNSLAARSDRDRAVKVLLPQLEPVAHFDDDRAARQGRVALALLRLGQGERVWPLLAQRPDPSVRTEIVLDAARYGVAPGAIVAHLLVEPDVSARRALVLCLGGYPASAVAEAERGSLVRLLLGWYRNDPDPGVHGAVDWLLRRKWDLAGPLDEIDRVLASGGPPVDRSWYVNGQGQTYTVVRGPVTFRMGSTPESDPDRAADETPHDQRIPRSFAIGTREVTAAAYGRFLDDAPGAAVDNRKLPRFLVNIPTPECAVGEVTWYEAARYCNWLSAKEGIPRDQWCYPARIGPGMKLPDDHLTRTGYRLPTAAEWEFACRAGTTSSRPYGRSVSRLGDFGWSVNESTEANVMHPAGRLLPNDLGLFDVLGNAFEWCADPLLPAAAGAPDGVPKEDVLTSLDVPDSTLRLLRSGAFNNEPTKLRSSAHISLQPGYKLVVIGFRIARTLP